jgi:DNA-binding NarL/FixJ family response regulator
MYDLQRPMKRTLLLEHASAVLIERPVATRRLLRSALHNIGLREMRELDQVPEHGAETELLHAVDLVVVDVSEEDQAGAKLVSNIRRRIAAFNPFITTIATSFAATSKVINVAVNAGTDGILLKPFSQQQMYDQVLNLIERRRPFIVTANYIGPERRPGARNGASAAQSIDVPNTLRDKLVKGRHYNHGEATAEIESAWGRVNREFSLRGAVQILYLIRLAKAAIEDPTQEDVGRELGRLRDTAKDLLTRIAEAQLREIAAELTDWVTHRLDIRLGVGNAVALEKITHLTATLACLLGSLQTPEELILQADRAVFDYRARQAAAAVAASGNGEASS